MLHCCSSEEVFDFKEYVKLVLSATSQGRTNLQPLEGTTLATSYIIPLLGDVQTDCQQLWYSQRIQKIMARPQHQSNSRAVQVQQPNSGFAFVSQNKLQSIT